DRRKDATAALRDFNIWDASQPQLPFGGAGTAINEMGVAVDETGSEEPSPAVNRLALERAHLRGVHRQYRRDTTILIGQRSILVKAERHGDTRVESREVRVGPQPVEGIAGLHE